MAARNATFASSTTKTLATLRLQQDLQEFMRAPPLPREKFNSGIKWGIEAQPTDENIFVWDALMMAASGPLRGQEVRMRLVFPDNYPANPPDVKLLTSIESHPNVFGAWICLDMLKNPEMYASPYKGWSAAYRVSAILLQLYGFLLVDESMDQLYGGNVKRKGANRGAAVAVVATLASEDQPAADKQNGVKPAGPSNRAGRKLAATADKLDKGAVISASNGSCSAVIDEGMLERLDDHLMRAILSGLAAKDLLNCMATAPSRLARVAADVKQRGDLECFYTKRRYTDEVLGFGVSREWHAGRRSNELRALVVRLDYLSLSTFVEAKVRRSAWNAPIDAFLPLYLNPDHGQRALKALPGCVEHILSKNLANPSINASMGGAAPRWLLRVLAQAMNSLVVEMVRLDKGDVPTHMSDAALRGFAHLHHLLVAVALGPHGVLLVDEARRDVKRFIVDGKSRHKSTCPDLGVLLVELMLVPKEEVPWGDFLPPFLRELLARQVRWVIKPEDRPKIVESNPYTQAAAQWAGMPGCNCDMCTAARARAAAAHLAAAKAKQNKPAAQASSSTKGPRVFNFGVVAGENLQGDGPDSFKRMKQHFESAVTGLRTVQLTCWFGLELARPQTEVGLMKELEVVKQAYDECSGAPPALTLDAFNQHARKVLAAGSWGAALGGLRVGVRCEGVKPDPRPVWASALRQAVLDSYLAGYHNDPAPWGSGPPEPVQGTYRPPAKAPQQPPPPLSPPLSSSDAAGVGGSGWTQVVRKVPSERPKTKRQEGPWSGVYVSDARRLANVKRVFGSPFVDWEGENKPVMALEEGK